jgi:uncharacterized protein
VTAPSVRAASVAGKAAPGTLSGPRARLSLRVRPGSRENSVHWDRWRKVWIVSVTAEPVEGAANRALLSFLADRLGVPGSAVRLLRGATSSAKKVEVTGLSDEEVERRLAASPP